MLEKLEQVQSRVASGQVLLLAGDEALLAQVPRGKWIGGTIPYFMDGGEGLCSRDQIFVTEIPQSVKSVEVRRYDETNINQICLDAPSSGFTALLLPCGSPVHGEYARNAANFEEMFLKPVVGWVTGMHLDDLGRQTAKTACGGGPGLSATFAVAMHVELDPRYHVELDILNPFVPGDGDVIEFPEDGFHARQCVVNGVQTNCARYFTEINKDPKLPLAANYNGTIVNVSVQAVNVAEGTVDFYAPVFRGVEYRIAAAQTPSTVANGDVVETQPLFACNCVLNYLNGFMVGQDGCALRGPVTFGEIANLLLNQTLVRLFVRASH